MYNSLYGIKVSSGSCLLASYPVLQQIAIQRPVHAFYRSVIAHNEPNAGVSVGRLLAHIQPLFSGLCARRLLYRVGFIFYNPHVSSPFFLVGYDVKTVKDTIGSGFDYLSTYFAKNQRNPYHRKHIFQSSNRPMNYEPCEQKAPSPPKETLTIK